MSISKQQLVAELGAYARTHNKEIASMFYDVPVLDKYLKPISKVQGQFPSLHSVTSNVVQRFRPQWDAQGDTKFKAKILKSTRIKVNYEFIPADVLASWISFLYAENMKKEAMPISKYIMEKELGPKILEDMAWLMINGEDNANPYGQFEYAFPGLVAALEAAIADSDNPAYRIPIQSITESNALDQFMSFERAIPTKAKRFVKEIFCSEHEYECYMIDVRNTYGQNTNFTSDFESRSPLGGRKIIPLPYLPNGNVFATVPGNMVKLIDIFNKPEINDIQIADYKVKVFGEMEIGVDFALNQAVFVGNFEDSSSGFAAAGSGAADMKKLYYVE